MGFDEGRLEFNRPNLVYNAGEVIYGKLIFDQGKGKSFRGIYVKLKGKCEVKWTTHHTRRSNNRSENYTVDHTSYESYCDLKVYLVGCSEGEVAINPGHYEYPFQLMIPLNVPSSFEGSNGHIRYEVKAVVDRSFKFDQEKCMPITVLNRRDLNADPYCKNPTIFEFEKTLCCWCMSQGLCTVNVNLPQSGYCPGQTIRVEVTCVNNSNVEIKCLKFELFEKTHYTATNHYDTRSDKNTVVQLRKGPIPKNTTRNWTVEIDIPNIDVKNVDACKYIDIEHWFEVTVSPSGCHTNSEDKHRLILGHIPLREFDEGAPDSAVSQAYQPANEAYLIFQPQPYPAPIAPYPGVNITEVTAPYPTSQPNPVPGHNPPYPGTNTTPYPGASPAPPYPISNPPYPAAAQLPMVSPYPVGNPNIAGPGQPGFTVGIDNQNPASVPRLPPTANVPYPPNPAIAANPFASASAPDPSTLNVTKSSLSFNTQWD